MGFYTTTSVTEKPHPETPSCAQKTASGKFFTYPIKTQYKNRHNSLKTNQEKPLPTQETASGVFYYKFRHYSAELGRWPSRDPIEEDGGVNLYVFVGNDPIKRWDALGLVEIEASGITANPDCYWADFVIDLEVEIYGTDEKTRLLSNITQKALSGLAGKLTLATVKTMWSAFTTFMTSTGNAYQLRLEIEMDCDCECQFWDNSIEMEKIISANDFPLFSNKVTNGFSHLNPIPAVEVYNKLLKEKIALRSKAQKECENLCDC